MKFRLQADFTFEADDIEDALDKLSLHFATVDSDNQFQSDLEFVGDVSLSPQET